MIRHIQTEYRSRFFSIPDPGSGSRSQKIIGSRVRNTGSECANSVNHNIRVQYIIYFKYHYIVHIQKYMVRQASESPPRILSS